MSTGDQTEYVRGKMAERGVGQQATFMKDGFDRWAESSEPAREGQMEKTPAETQMEGRGGALSVKSARKLYSGMQVGKKAVKYAKSKYDELAGGATVNEIKEQAKAVLDVYRKISKFIDAFIQDLDDEIIENPQFESKPGILDFANRLKAWLKSISVYKDTLDQIAAAAASIGLGRQPRGGAISLEDVGKYATQVLKMYSWAKTNTPYLRVVLKFKSLQPVGQKILDALDPLMKAVGLGRGGKKPSSTCQCDDMHGGAEVSFSGEGGVKPIGEDFEEEEEVNYFMDGLHKKAKAGPRKVYAEEVTGRMIGYGSGRKVGGMEYVQSSDSLMEEQLKLMGLKSPKEMKKMAEKASEDALRMAHGAIPRGAIPRPVGGATCGGKKPSARGAIVKKIMKEKGLSLPQASKYVKDNGLY